MSRIDDYKTARQLAVDNLLTVSFDVILKRSGFESVGGEKLRVPFLNRVYHITFPGLEFKDEADSRQEIPIQEQILILHYMLAPATAGLTGNWVSYREIPGASFYYRAFVKRAIDPLKKVFGDQAERLSAAADILGALRIDSGDAGCELRLLPRVPLRLILWAGDEEFPAEANMLFDENIKEILSAEDIAWLAGMLAYRLIALSR